MSNDGLRRSLSFGKLSPRRASAGGSRNDLRSGSPRDTNSGDLRAPQLSPKRSLVDRLKFLGKGGSGSEVYVVKVDGWTCCNHEKIVVHRSKVIRFSSSSLPDVTAFEKEIEILKDLPSHIKFVVKYLGFQRTEEQLEVFTSLYEGNLLEVIEKRSQQFSPFNNREILVIADAMLNALVILHSRKLIHRDVKSANVFYEIVGGKTNYVLGLGKLKFIQSSPNPVEYELMTLKIPFFEINLGVETEIRRGTLPTRTEAQKLEYASLSTLYDNCLKVNPAERWSALEALSHVQTLKDIV